MATPNPTYDWLLQFTYLYRQFPKFTSWTAFYLNGSFGAKNSPAAIRDSALLNLFSSLKQALGVNVGAVSVPELTTPADWIKSWLTLRSQLSGILNTNKVANAGAILAAMDKFYNTYIAPNISKLPKNLQP